MEQLHYYGMLFIQMLQKTFKRQSKLMIWISHFSSPHWSYTVYFPLAYCLNKAVGRRVLLVAATSEWLNAILKWILHGERPYWWAHEAGMCKGTMQPCNQFYITCETGPGSPSGHCMVTVSVFYVLVSALMHHVFSKRPDRSLAGLTLWTMFIIVTCAINISRCFISAHFPHQVICGSIVGILTAMCFSHLSISSLSLKHYLLVAVGMLLSSAVVYSTLIQLGLDPLWSVSKAERWCAHAEWIHLSTTLFFAVVKASSSFVGLGLAEFTCVQLYGVDENGPRLSFTLRIISIVLTLIFSYFAEKVIVPEDPAVVFYLLSYIKYVLVIFIIGAVIPSIMNLFSVKTVGKSNCD